MAHSTRGSGLGASETTRPADRLVGGPPHAPQCWWLSSSAGFSTTSVEQRIKNAEKSPTYLMAPVKVVADYRLYNVKVSWLEHLLHRVFAEVRLDLTQVDKNGRNYDPSEWFVVPYDVINQAVTMIISGEITNYVYDKAERRLVERDR
mgnify:CR=1 FL=1